jgi:hypothetical protein
MAICGFGIVGQIDEEYGHIFPWPPPNPMPNVEVNELIVEAHAEA